MDRFTMFEGFCGGLGLSVKGVLELLAICCLKLGCLQLLVLRQ